MECSIVCQWSEQISTCRLRRTDRLKKNILREVDRHISIIVLLIIYNIHFSGKYNANESAALSWNHVCTWPHAIALIIGRCPGRSIKEGEGREPLSYFFLQQIVFISLPIKKWINMTPPPIPTTFLGALSM